MRGTLLFCVGATPTKPLLPTHLRGLIWVETALRAAQYTGSVDCVGNGARVLWDSSIQTLRFWDFLDRCEAAASFEGVDDKWVGRAYVASHRKESELSATELARAQRSVVDEGWCHPSARVVRQKWEESCDKMAIFHPSSELPVDSLMPLDALLDALSEQDLLLDLRPIGGGVYIDLTGRGVSLRPLVDAEGRQNYLSHVLRYLFPQAVRYKRIVLVHDTSSQLDFTIASKVLARRGATVERISVGRMATSPGGGTSRDGDWGEAAAGDLCDRYLEKYSRDVFRIGLRIYFILYHPVHTRAEFSHVELERAMHKAERVLRVAKAGGLSRDVDLRALMEPLRRRRFYRMTGLVDPHALLTLLFQERNLCMGEAPLRACCL